VPFHGIENYVIKLADNLRFILQKSVPNNVSVSHEQKKYPKTNIQASTNLSALSKSLHEQEATNFSSEVSSQSCNHRSDLQHRVELLEEGFESIRMSVSKLFEYSLNKDKEENCSSKLITTKLSKGTQTDDIASNSTLKQKATKKKRTKQQNATEVPTSKPTSDVIPINRHPVISCPTIKPVPTPRYRKAVLKPAQSNTNPFLPLPYPEFNEQFKTDVIDTNLPNSETINIHLSQPIQSFSPDRIRSRNISKSTLVNNSGSIETEGTNLELGHETTDIQMESSPKSSSFERKQCIVIHGFAESDEQLPRDKLFADLNLFQKCLQLMLVENESITVLKAFRLGRPDDTINASSKPRPLKLILEDEYQAELLLKRKHMLKFIQPNVFFQPDYTSKDRDKLRETLKELKRRKGCGERNLRISNGVIISTPPPFLWKQPITLRANSTA
jgi:hypothetical protein